MRKSLISSMSLGIITFFITRASYFFIANSLIINNVKQDSYISLLIGFLLSILVLIIYLKISNHDKSIIENNKKLFGNILGNLINFIIVITILSFGIIILNKFTNFIYLNYLQHSSKIIISISFIVIVMYASLKGIETITKTSQLLSILSFILFIISITSLIYYINVDNIKPVLNTGLSNILKCSIDYMVYSVTPVFLILIIPKNRVKNESIYNKSIVIGFIIGFISIFLTVFSSITILGNLTNVFTYPFYMVLKQIDYFHFFERIENILAIIWIIDCFILLIMIVYFIKKYFISVLKINNKKTQNIIIMIIGLIFIVFSNIISVFKTLYINLLIDNYYILLCFSFIIIPIITFFKSKKDT